MLLDRRIKVQLVIFTVISVLAGGVMAFRYINAPAMLFGIGHYKVTAELRRAAGLYPSANVTYRGTEVGRVQSVRLTETGVKAELLLDSGIKIPAQLQAQVHSQSAIGELYLELRPRTGDGPALKDGDVIPVGGHLGSAGHRLVARRHRPRAGRDPAGQPQNGHRRKLHRCRGIGP